MTIFYKRKGFVEVMKKFWAFVLLAALTVGFTACDMNNKSSFSTKSEPSYSSGVDNKSSFSIESESSYSSGVDNESSFSTESESSYTMRDCTAFSNGYAFIEFYVDDGDDNVYPCNGIIDTKGKLQTYIENYDYSELTQNTSGYMHREKGRKFYVIAPDGNLTAFTLDDNTKVQCYQDGYVMTVENKSGFDAIEYIYHIYDSSGKELSAYSAGAEPINDVYYIGEGTFLFFYPGYYDFFGDANLKNRFKYGGDYDCADIYFAQSNTWLKNQTVLPAIERFDGRSFAYRDGVFMFDDYDHEGKFTYDDQEVEFTYVNSKGELKTVVVPSQLCNNPYFRDHADGIMLFTGLDPVSYSSTICCYNVQADKWISYKGKYVDRLALGSHAVTGEGCTAILLEGADGKLYTMLLDKDMQDMLDSPLPGRPYAIQDGVLYLWDQDYRGTLNCYDLKGTQLGEISSVREEINWLEEGIIVGGGTFYRADGSKAFEIDYSTGKLIALPE